MVRSSVSGGETTGEGETVVAGLGDACEPCTPGGLTAEPVGLAPAPPEGAELLGDAAQLPTRRAISKASGILMCT